MPKFTGRTVQIKNNGQPIWQQGDRTIWEVVVDAGGHQASVKTYSQAIAQVGFQGEMETYEKPGRNGSETFVRQAPKEDGYPPRVGGTTSARSNYTPRDDAAIKAMWAVGQAVTLVTSDDIPLVGDGLQEIEDYATRLFHMVDRVKTSSDPAITPEENPHRYDTSFGTASEPDPSELNNLFPSDTQADDGSNPWPNSPRA
jgi:hypothetical protein